RLDKTTAKPNLTAQVLLFRDGKAVFTGKVQPVDATNQTDMKRLIAGGALQMGTDLSAGEYALEVVVTDALADEKHRTAVQWMDFEIVKQRASLPADVLCDQVGRNLMSIG